LKANQLILFCALVLCIASCSTDYVPVTEQSSNETVIIAELEVGKDVSMMVSSTYGPDEAAVFPNDIDGEVRISNVTTNQIDKELRYFETSWFDQSFKFNSGHELILETDFSTIGLGKTSSTITVPTKGSITAKSARSSTTGNDGYFTIDLEFQEIPEGDYYHFKPYIIDNNNDVSFLDVINVVENSESAYVLSHMDGMLIDYQLLQGDKHLVINTKSKSLANPSSSTIHLMLKTVPETYYKFHKSLTEQKETQQGPFDAPVTTYTNIEGGQGIFVAYHTSLESVVIQ